MCLLFYFYRHLGVSGCLPSLHNPAPHCACSLHPFLHPHVDFKAWMKMLIVSGRWSLFTGWNWVILAYQLLNKFGGTHTEEPCRIKDSLYPGFGADTPPTWNWRNLFRTPSVRSGATAPCRKRHGQRTKVSISKWNMILFYRLVGRKGSLASLFSQQNVSLSLWNPSEQLALKWLIVTHKGLGSVALPRC